MLNESGEIRDNGSPGALFQVRQFKVEIPDYLKVSLTVSLEILLDDPDKA
jgi:hypothetical protein